MHKEKNFKNINKILKKNILIIIMLILLCPFLAISYAEFIIKTDIYRSNEMYIAELLYSLKINNDSTYTLNVPVGESEHIIEITSLNTISSNYKLIYKNNDNIKVEYASDYKDPTFGLITNTRTIYIRLTNNTSSTQNITFSVAGGYSFNNLSDIDIPNGYTEITIDYWKYDYETTALYIDDKRVEELDKNKYYALTSYTCSNDATATYNTINRIINIKSDKQTKCSLYFNETQAEFNFSYSGKEDTFPITNGGYYKLEVWGAAGGYGKTTTYSGGYGGYSTGIVNLSVGETLYMNIGGKGTDQLNVSNSNVTGGYNGGGQAHGYTDKYVGSGGGATHIAKSSGLLSTFSSNLNNLLIVAGGGGGGAYETSSANAKGGSAGGYIGVNSSSNAGTGGSQTSGGTGAYRGSFGKGASCSTNGCSGGGGGLYGGGSGEYYRGAGGGSGYIANILLTNKEMYCYGCTSSNEFETKTTSTTCNDANPLEKCAKQGNGHIKITYLGTILD